MFLITIFFAFFIPFSFLYIIKIRPKWHFPICVSLPLKSQEIHFPWKHFFLRLQIKFVIFVYTRLFSNKNVCSTCLLKLTVQMIPDLIKEHKLMRIVYRYSFPTILWYISQLENSGFQISSTSDEFRNAVVLRISQKI